MEDIIKLYNHHMRQNADFTGMKREEVPPVVRYINQGEPRSNIRYADLTTANADEIIEREIAYFKSIGHHLEWTLYDYDQPDDVQARLEAQGFEIGEVEAILVLDIENLPEKLQRDFPQDIRRITEPEQVEPIIRKVQNPVFGDEDNDWLIRQVTSYVRDHGDMYQVYAAFVDGEPASAAWIDFIAPESPFAGLYGGATLEEHRGKGLYSALIAARAKEAQKRGVRYLTVDASPMSRPILERIGFRQIALSWACDH